MVSKQQPRDAGMFVLQFRKVMLAAKGHLMALLVQVHRVSCKAFVLSLCHCLTACSASQLWVGAAT